MEVPPATPPSAFEEGLLDVGDGHRLYWRVQGDPALPACCVLHGGPGGSLNPRVLGLFDLSRWRVVLYDQRGCGRSTPAEDTAHNTTRHLVEDLDRLRQALGIERWALFGGSWGARLAMSYGIAHPGRCLGFMMRGVFLGRREDIEWFLWDVRRIYPDRHAALLSVIEQWSGRRPQGVDELLELSAPLLQPGHAGRPALGQAWEDYESAMSAVRPSDPTPAPARGAGASRESMTLAVLEHHYMRNVLPLEAAILPELGRIAHLPSEIVHGRHDVVCPLEQAWLVAEAWPAARLVIAGASGHWGFAPEVAEGIRQGLARLSTRIQDVA